MVNGRHGLTVPGGRGGLYVTPRHIVGSSATGDNNFKVFCGITSITIAVCFRTELLKYSWPQMTSPMTCDTLL